MVWLARPHQLDARAAARSAAPAAVARPRGRARADRPAPPAPPAAPPLARKLGTAVGKARDDGPRQLGPRRGPGPQRGAATATAADPPHRPRRTRRPIPTAPAPAERRLTAAGRLRAAWGRWWLVWTAGVGRSLSSPG